MERGHPFQDLLLGRAAAADPHLANDVVEVFALDRGFVGASAPERGRDGFKQPKDFLNGTASLTLIE